MARSNSRSRSRQRVLEDLREVGRRRALREDLVVNTAKERFVDQFGRLDVRREDDEHHERQVDLLARLQRQEVDAAFERRDPAVEQRVRRALLPAEVVDDEHAAVGDELDRRAVELRHRAVGQVERVERQLAADRDERPPAADPPPVVRVLRFEAHGCPRPAATARG